ncbi:DUF3829 domain-containing protein [Pedobacter petrophilus]|uniref:DUF3829 domain-containing protein n=1 Tax=Pedobacter petrophilus TaxID=1908241 RepID=A0A7K0G2V1_9SPHI|nr:DUF3829 domain-containing protein [Pedobacter petrophilus]MRX77730.1 DUF3829 domain-containing protein [Pedobacter petrophilus]
MKFPIKLLAIAVAISFTACKGGDKKETAAKTEYAAAGNDDANQIVEYNNVLVSLTDQNNAYLKRVGENLQKLAKGLANPNDRFAFIGIVSPFSSSGFSHSELKPETPPSSLSNADQKYFKENVAGLNETLAKIKDTYKALDDYIKAEDWKDDKSAKGNKLIDSIYSMNKTYYKYDENLLARLEVIGDDAERVILKTHPLKEYIFAMKDDRKAVGEFNKLLIETKDFKANEAKIKSAYETLAAQNTKHIEMSAPDATKFPSKDGAFKTFNDSFKDYLIEAKKAIRDASVDGKLTQGHAEDLIGKYEYMRTTYNYFVD